VPSSGSTKLGARFRLVRTVDRFYHFIGRLNRSASGVGLSATLEAGEQTREAALALLVAWHIAQQTAN
jgi:hypothetical protein